MTCRPPSRVLPPAWRFFLAPLFAATLVSTSLAAPSRTTREAPVDLVPEVGGRIPLFVETTAGASLAARVEELGGSVQHVFENVDGLAILLPPGAVAQLEADARVASVERQRFVHQAVSEPRILERFRKAGMSDRASRVHHGAGATSSLDLRGARFVPVDPRELAGDLRTGSTSFLGYDLITGASEAWEETDFGEGSLVAIVDTGVFPGHPLLQGNVIGGINFVPPEEEEAIDLDDDGVGDGHSFDWKALENDDHGTFCAGLIAGHADLEMPADEAFVQSVAFHSPKSVEIEGDVARIHLMGTAPSASLYAVKVFPFLGGSAPDARIGEALDYLISAKKHGDLDIDVISMSLSGPVLNDGRYFLDRLVDKATREGMTCVVAAANEGPAHLSVGSPGSARDALTVGGAIDPLHFRVAIETLFGLPVGGGMVAYPHDLQVVDFSSCGLTADGRVKPGLLATGLLVFSSTLVDFSGDGLPDAPSFGFGSGTSFSTPTVAGAAALCAAFEKSKGRRHGHGSRIANALMRAADPIAPFSRVSGREQGAGFVRVPEALKILEDGGGHRPPQLEWRDPLVRFVSLSDGEASASAPELSAGETYQVYVHVPHGVGVAHVVFPEVSHSGDENPFVGDGLQATIHSAKRGGSGDYVFGAGPLEIGDSFEWEMPEAGTARITFSAMPTNYGKVSGAVELKTEPLSIESDKTFTGIIRHDGVVSHSFLVPEGVSALAVRASWEHDWSRFPTYDLDLFLQGPDGVIPAASLDSPETAYVEAPTPGEWTLRLLDFSSVRGREPYRLDVSFVGPWISGEGDGDPGRASIVTARTGAQAQQTEIRFAIPRAGRATLDVFDVAGRRVRRLAEGVREAGEHDVAWDERDADGGAVAAGVYFLRLDTENGVATRKVVLVR